MIATTTVPVTPDTPTIPVIVVFQLMLFVPVSFSMASCAKINRCVDKIKIAISMTAIANNKRSIYQYI